MFTTGKVNYIAQVGDYIYSFTPDEQILSLGYLGRYALAWLPLKIPHLLTFSPYLQAWMTTKWPKVTYQLTSSSYWLKTPANC